MEASTQKLLHLCQRVELACDRIPGAASAERTASALHTLLPHDEARGHKTTTRQDNVHAREAARRCEIVADDTPALDADWGKFHNPGRTPGLARSSAGAKDARLTRFDDRTYVRARVCPFGV